MALQLLLGLSQVPSLSVLALAWFLTYSLHALLWASAAALLARVTRLAATRHTLWKLALFGPLLSAALSVVLPLSMQRTRQDMLHVREVTVLSFADAPASRPALEPQVAAAAPAQAALRCSALRASRPRPACWLVVYAGARRCAIRCSARASRTCANVARGAARSG
jgi:hypothetical protein